MVERSLVLAQSTIESGAETNKRKVARFLRARDEQCPRPFPKVSRNSLSKFESTGHLHLRTVGRKKVDAFNAFPPCYHYIKTSRAGGHI